MSRQIAPDELEAACRALIAARRTNLGVEIALPVIYPTGEAVRVVVVADGGEYVVHDASHGAMCLTAAGVRFTRELEARLVRLAESFGCDYLNGRISTRCREDQLAVAIALVANASRGVGDESRTAAPAARDFAGLPIGSVPFFGRRGKCGQASPLWGRPGRAAGRGGINPALAWMERFHEAGNSARGRAVQRAPVSRTRQEWVASKAARKLARFGPSSSHR